ncbi:MAG: hypothetical protein U0326_39355 [Polyangiales bacterium]
MDPSRNARSVAIWCRNTNAAAATIERGPPGSASSGLQALSDTRTS